MSCVYRPSTLLSFYDNACKSNVPFIILTPDISHGSKAPLTIVSVWNPTLQKHTPLRLKVKELVTFQPTHYYHEGQATRSKISTRTFYK